MHFIITNLKTRILALTVVVLTLLTSQQQIWASQSLEPSQRPLVCRDIVALASDTQESLIALLQDLTREFQLRHQLESQPVLMLTPSGNLHIILQKIINSLSDRSASSDAPLERRQGYQVARESLINEGLLNLKRTITIDWLYAYSVRVASAWSFLLEPEFRYIELPPDLENGQAFSSYERFKLNIDVMEFDASLPGVRGLISTIRQLERTQYNSKKDYYSTALIVFHMPSIESLNFTTKTRYFLYTLSPERHTAHETNYDPLRFIEHDSQHHERFEQELMATPETPENLHPEWQRFSRKVVANILRTQDEYDRKALNYAYYILWHETRGELRKLLLEMRAKALTNRGTIRTLDLGLYEKAFTTLFETDKNDLPEHLDTETQKEAFIHRGFQLIDQIIN